MALSGCYTTQVAPDTAAKANAAFREIEKNPRPGNADPELTERLIRLWSDVPEYLPLIRFEKVLKKAPRLVSSVPPTYPLVPLLGNVKATVLVSFVIDEKGNVESARVLESADARFNESAIAAVLKWTFLPAETEDGLTKTFITVPIQFNGKKG